ncbi:MAG: hypothetical protein ACKN9I_04945, partial [Alphaproteobacteria bacterium]
MQSSSPKPAKIQTSGHKNLCGLYSVLNSILAGSKQDQSIAFQNMGLNEETANQYYYKSLLPLHDDYDGISAKKSLLISDANLALSEILEYKLEVNKIEGLDDQEKRDLESQIIKEVGLAMQDPRKKQELIDEYCEFLFY